MKHLSAIEQSELEQAILCIAKTNYQSGVKLVADLINYKYGPDALYQVFEGAKKKLIGNTAGMVFYSEGTESVSGDDIDEKASMYMLRITDTLDMVGLDTIDTTYLKETIEKVAINCPSNLKSITSLAIEPLNTIYCEALLKAKAGISNADSANMELYTKKENAAISAIDVELRKTGLHFE